MRLTIITGASRGMGAAMARQIAARSGQVLLTLARGPAPELSLGATSRHEHWKVDLAEPGPVAARLAGWLAAQRAAVDAGAVLINNAGMLGEVGAIDGADPALTAEAVRVNLEAPILLTQAFLRATAGWPGPRDVLQISSGAGRNAYAGWSLYCATKAGLDHFTRAAVLDEAQRPEGTRARLVSLAPGVIDTAMQDAARKADPKAFPELQRFLDLKANNQLATPEAAATRVLAYLERPDFGSKPTADVRDT